VPISWDEALETIADRLRTTIEQHGPEAIWPFLGSGSMGLLQGAYGAGRRLWNVIGASRHVQTPTRGAERAADSRAARFREKGWRPSRHQARCRRP
jgi:anaerobic selenocysteine-containing dehydrogenase